MSEVKPPSWLMIATLDRVASKPDHPLSKNRQKRATNSIHAHLASISKSFYFRIGFGPPFCIINDLWWILISTLGQMSSSIYGGYALILQTDHSWPFGPWKMLNHPGVSQTMKPLFAHTTKRFNSSILAIADCESEKVQSSRFSPIVSNVNKSGG